MPRYFLNLRRHAGVDGLAEDREGDVVPSEAMLREHVLETARNLIAKARLEVVRNWYDCSFEVTNEAGHHVMMVLFADLAPRVGHDRPGRG